MYKSCEFKINKSRQQNKIIQFIIVNVYYLILFISYYTAPKAMIYNILWYVFRNVPASTNSLISNTHESS